MNSGAQGHCKSSVPRTCASRLHFRLVHALLETLRTCALPTSSAGLTGAGWVSRSLPVLQTLQDGDGSCYGFERLCASRVVVVVVGS